MRRTRRPTTLLALTPLLALGLLLSGCADTGGPTPLAPEAEVLTSDHRGFPEGAFVAQLAGENEVPPVTTLASGQAVFTISEDESEIAFTLSVQIANVTQAHIHIGEEGVNGPVVVWLYPSGPPATLIPGRTVGLLSSGVITEESLVGQWADEPLSTLIEAMQNEAVYVNVHTTAYPPGEIRGQIREWSVGR